MGKAAKEIAGCYNEKKKPAPKKKPKPKPKKEDLPERRVIRGKKVKF